MERWQENKESRNQDFKGSSNWENLVAEKNSEATKDEADLERGDGECRHPWGEGGLALLYKSDGGAHQKF